MNSLEKQIVWTKLNFNFDSYDDDNNDDDDEDFDDLINEDEYSEIDRSILQNLPKILSTPMGLYKIDDKLSPIRLFDFWIASTNFNISKNVVMVLNEIPGVEKLIVLSRYTFILGIGKLFDFYDVKESIENKLCFKNNPLSMITNNDIKQKIMTDYDKICKNKYWAFHILPNGDVDQISSNDLNEDFLNKLYIYKQSRDSCSSMILCSNNVDELLNEKRD